MKDKKMETLTATLATLLAIWVLTCVAFYVHANTQDKILASYRAYAKRLVTERDTLANSISDLLEAHTTLTADRDEWRTQHGVQSRIVSGCKVEIQELHTALAEVEHGAYCDRQGLNERTVQRDELRTELEQAKPRIAELEQALRIERMTLERTMASKQELQRQVWRIELAERAQAFNIGNA
jgi:chromosome segregation ATPase